MQEDMAALKKNGTWDLVDLPRNKVHVNCEWMYTIKLKLDGIADHYKAWLVAKGYTQTYGIDYQEAFAPMAKLNSIWVLLSIATNQDWPIHQFDVKNVFLHVNLVDQIYTKLPPSFFPSTSKGKVYKLKRSLYGLKQSLQTWFERFLLQNSSFW